MSTLEYNFREQQGRNEQLRRHARHLGVEISRDVLPLRIDLATTATLPHETIESLEALQVESARIAIRAVSNLAAIGESDSLGGALELIPPLLLSALVSDGKRIDYTIEHAHTSIGYYATLASLGYLSARDVERGFRCGADFPGHVAWVPGGTQLNGGRLGVMIPSAVAQALGKSADYGDGCLKDHVFIGLWRKHSAHHHRSWPASVFLFNIND